MPPPPSRPHPSLGDSGKGPSPTCQGSPGEAVAGGTGDGLPGQQHALRRHVVHGHVLHAHRALCGRDEAVVPRGGCRRAPLFTQTTPFWDGAECCAPRCRPAPQSSPPEQAVPGPQCLVFRAWNAFCGLRLAGAAAGVGLAKLEDFRRCFPRAPSPALPGDAFTTLFPGGNRGFFPESSGLKQETVGVSHPHFYITWGKAPVEMPPESREGAEGLRQELWGLRASPCSHQPCSPLTTEAATGWGALSIPGGP